MQNNYSIETVRPEVYEGVELYVSADGKESGMSMRGLAAFIGVSPSLLSEKLLPKLEDALFTSELPDSLQPFAGKAFHCSLNGERGAKIVPAKTCEAIVFHYAFENNRISDTTRQQARLAYRKFAQMGIHNWICQAVGVIEKRDDSQLLSLVQEVLSEVKGLREVATEYKAIREKTTTHMPGADFLLTELSDTNALPSADGALSLEQWLATKGINLEKPQFHRLAQIVADTYRSLVKKDPEQRKVIYKGKAKYKLAVYQPEHFAILQISLNKLLAD